MKPSRYNFFYNYGKNGYAFVAYNSFSNAMALMTQEQFDQFCDFQTHLDVQLDQTYVEELKKGSFIVDDEVDELALIRERMLSSRYNTSHIGFTLAPTLECNFRCIYCYEKGCEKKGTMSKEVQDAIVNYVERRATTIGNLSITWYGGEPLLALDIIENLTERFLDICSRNKINYSAGIVTNGYLLNKKNLDRLVKCKVNHCQVTIDGDRETHNQRRPHYLGVDTYDTIIQNACEASKFFPISIRVNIDKKNMNGLLAINQRVKENGVSNIFIYPAPIKVNNECYVENVCLNNSDFFEFEYEFISSNGNDNDWLRKYPTLYGNSCCADCASAFVVGEDGSLYKCWSDIGRHELACGNIVDEKIDVSKMIRYSKYDPTRDEKCSKCKFLPICMGGCMRDVYERPHDRCEHVERLHELYVKKIAEKLELMQDRA